MASKSEMEEYFKFDHDLGILQVRNLRLKSIQSVIHLMKKGNFKGVLVIDIKLSSDVYEIVKKELDIVLLRIYPGAQITVNSKSYINPMYVNLHTLKSSPSEQQIETCICKSGLLYANIVYSKSADAIIHLVKMGHFGSAREIVINLSNDIYNSYCLKIFEGLGTVFPNTRIDIRRFNKK